MRFKRHVKHFLFKKDLPLGLAEVCSVKYRWSQIYGKTITVWIHLVGLMLSIVFLSCVSMTPHYVLVQFPFSHVFPILICTPWFHLTYMCPLILTDGLGQLRFTRSIPTAPSFLYLFLYSVIAFFVYIYCFYCCNVCPLIGFLCILCPPPSLVSISLAYPLDPRVNQCCLVFNYHIPSNLIHLSLSPVTLILSQFYFF